MPGGAPEVPPGLQGRAPPPKRSRSAGAAPSASSPSITTTPTAAPTAYGPPGAAGAYRRAPDGQTQQPTPANPESAR
eukprot:10148870-Alexandrium_andersonii.AAC.1